MPIKPFVFSVIFSLFLGTSSQAQQSNSKENDYDRGYRFLYNNQLDSAFVILKRYTKNADDSLKKGMAYMYIGEMLWNAGDFYGAQENFMGTLQTLNKNDKSHYEYLGYTYNVLGNVSLDLKLYDEAIEFYNKGIPFSTTVYLPELINGKATAYQKKENYSEAIAIYDSLLSVKINDKMLLARIIDNRAYTKWLDDTNYPALNEFHSALKLRTDNQYTEGLNASYAHLSDYYAIYKTDSALWYAQKMLEAARKNQRPDDILEAIDKLIFLNSDAVSKDQWYKTFKKLNDSLRFARDTTRNHFALLKYEFPEIKAFNQSLQQRIKKQRTWIYIVTAAALIIIAGIYVLYTRRKKRIQQASIIAIQKERLNTSQKVHDVVANGLYVIMNELEHGETVEREPLITKIEGLYEKSRNISYEDASSGNTADYDEQIRQLLRFFANEQTKVVIVGNEPAFWKRITVPQKYELQLVLNELMVNMKKHSQAKNVAIVFRQENNKGFITYTDDGVGFNPDPQFGNGLNNMVNRINSLNGEVIFGKSGNGGASVAIGFPLQSIKT